MKNAMRDHVRDRVGQMARLVTHDARSMARGGASGGGGRLCDWLDGKASSHEHVFADAMLPVLAVVAPEASLRDLTGAFFAGIIGPLHAATQLSGSQFESGVEEACANFETTIADELIGLIWEPDHGQESTTETESAAA